jgi:hypothetical protein
VSPKQDQGQRNQSGAIDNGVEKTKKINKGPIDLVEYECRCTERRARQVGVGKSGARSVKAFCSAAAKGGQDRVRYQRNIHGHIPGMELLVSALRGLVRRKKRMERFRDS